MADVKLVIGVDESSTFGAMDKGIRSVIKNLNAKNYKIRVDIDTENINRFRSEITTLLNSMQNIGSSPLTGLNKSLLTSSREIERIKAQAGGMNGKQGAEITALTSKYNEFRSVLLSLQGKETISGTEIANATRLRFELAELINKYREKAAAENSSGNSTHRERDQNKAFTERATILTQVSKLIAHCTRNQQAWTAAAHGSTSGEYANYQGYIRQLEELSQKFQQNSITAEELKRRLRELQSDIFATDNVIIGSGKNVKSFSERFKNLTATFASWISITRLIYEAIYVIRRMVTNVKELDTAMTELKKVTDETDATYDRFLTNATRRAKEFGATLTDTVSATADFARLGYNIDASEKLADAALVYKNVGDGISDIGDASESIIATMQAFGDEVNPEQVMSIVDKFNEVGNNFAISSKGVGDALLRSASAMHAANSSLDETIALAAAANTIVQDPEKVGTALKTVSMYLRAAKTDAEDAGESTEGMASSVSELRKEILSLTGNRVDIQIDNDTFKTPYKIIQELSKVWGDLTDITQANILEMIGGKRNSNVVAALLENFSVAERALESSANAAGSALVENEKYLDSVEGKLSVFSATFEEFSQNIFSSDFVKSVLDIGSALLNTINVLKELGILLPVVAAGITAITAAFQAKRLIGISQDIIKQKGVTDALAISINGLTASQKNMVISELNAAMASGAFTEEQKEQIAVALGLITTTDGQVAANGRLALSFKAVAAAWLSSPMGKATIAIAAIALIAKGIEVASKSFEEMSEKAKESREAYENTISDIESLKSELESVREKIEEINKLDGISTVEQEELDRLETENALLSTKLSIKERLAAFELRESAKDAYNALTEKDTHITGVTNIDDSDGEASIPALVLGRYDIIEETEKWQAKLNDRKREYLELLKTQKALDPEKDSQRYKDISSLVDSANSDIETLEEDIGENIRNIQEHYFNLYDTAGNLIFDEFEGLANRAKSVIDEFLNKDIETDTEEVESALETVKSKVSDEIKSNLGELTPEKINIAYNMESLASDAGLELPDDVYSSWEAFRDLIDSISADNLKKSFIDVISKVDSLSAGLDQLSDIYKDVKDGEEFDYDKMLDNDEFKAEFGGLKEVYEGFIETISNSPNDIAACQSAFDNLATAYLANKSGLDSVTKSSKDAVVARLKQMGIANALNIVEGRLAVNEEKTSQAKKLGTDATWDKIAALYEEAKAGSVTKQALGELLAAEISAGNVRIDCASNVRQIISLANAAGASAEVLTTLKTVLKYFEAGAYTSNNPKNSKLNDLKGGNSSTKTTNASDNAYITGLINDLNNKIKKGELIDPEKYIANVSYGVNSGSDKGGSKASGEDKFSKAVSDLFDWIEIRLDRLQVKAEKYISKAEKYLDRGKYGSAQTQYENAMSVTSSQIKANQSGQTKYLNKANDILEKAVSQGIISKSQSKAIKSKVADGSIDISQYDEQMQTAIESYKEWYDKALDCSDKVEELLTQYTDYAEGLYNIPLDKAADKIEALDDKLSVLEAREEVANGYASKNTILSDIDKNAKSQNSAYQTALSEATSAVNSLWKSKDLQEALKASSNKNKNKGDELSLKGLEENSKAYKAVVKYNSAIKAQAKANQDAEKSAATYTKTLQENAKQRFDNVIEEYESAQSTLEASASLLTSKISGRSSLGQSQVSDSLKKEYENAINTNQSILNSQNAELIALRNAYNANQSSMSAEDRKAALADIAALEEKIIETKVNTADLQKELDNIEIKKLEIAMGTLKSEADGLQSVLDLKETKGLSATISDYNSLITNSKSQIANLESQNAELKRQQKNLDVNSERYQDLQEQINSNSEAIRDAKKSQEEWNNAIADLPFQELEKQLELLEAIGDKITSAIDLKTAQGKDLTTLDYYAEMSLILSQISVQTENMNEAYDNYLKSLSSSEGVFGGKSSEEWLSEYSQYASSINDLKVENEQLKDSMRDDIYWRTFERAHDAADRFSEVLSKIAGLISDDMMFDSNGNMTSFGVSKLAIEIKQLETARTEIQNYSSDIRNLNTLYSQGEYTEEEYKEKLAELQVQLLQSAQTMKSYSDNVMELYKDSAQNELDALMELIDARNKALDAKKAYYDYDKNIKEQTEDIRALQAQLAALEGIDNAEAKAKRAKLSAELADAQEELDDTINEHIFEMSRESLDDLKDVLQEAFDDRFEGLASNLEGIQSVISLASDMINSKTSEINNNLQELLNYYGITQEAMKSLVDSNNSDPSDSTNPLFSAIREMYNKGVSAVKVDASYSSGTLKVPRNLMARTNEDGSEIIVTKDGLITPLEYGDGVVPADLTKRLYEMAMDETSGSAVAQSTIRNLPKIDFNSIIPTSVTQYYENLINIEGSADAATVEDLKRMTNNILQKSFDFTNKKAYGDYIRSGGKRRI